METIQGPKLDLLVQRLKGEKINAEKSMDVGLGVSKGASGGDDGAFGKQFIWESFNVKPEVLEQCQEKVKTRVEAEIILRNNSCNIANKNSGELMLLAAQVGSISVIKFFESPGTSPITYQDSMGDCLLHFAAKGKQTVTIYYLIQRGLDPRTVNKLGETAIYPACETGNIEIVSQLAQNKMVNDVREMLTNVDIFGNTCLHIAARDGNGEICKYLVKKYKRLLKLDNQEGKTPLSYAQDNNHIYASNVLIEAGGEATYYDRTRKIRQLAEDLIRQPPDYAKSVFKPNAPRPLLFGKKVSRYQLMQERKELVAAAKQRKEEADAEDNQ